MLNYKIVLLGVMAVLALLLSCRGEPSPAPQTTEPPPAAQSTQTAHDPTTAPTSLAAGVASAAAATGRPSPTAVQERLSPTDPLPTTAVTPTNPPLPIPALAPATIPAEEIAAIRELAATYWQIFNDYNADGALSMLEESYRSLEDELIRRDIGRMKLFRVKLEVTEETTPTLNENGDYETYLSLKTPIDSRTVLMVFRHIDGQWWIVFSDEPDE